MRSVLGRGVLALGAMVALAGCSGNQLGEIIGAATGAGTPASGNPGTVSAEIQGVNTQQQTIQVTTSQGQSGSVRYDERTVVVYQNQQHPVTALERGDLVTLTIQELSGTTYVSRIDVQQSVQERTGSTGSGTMVQVSGRISNLNQTNGTFTLATTNGNITVSLPYNPPQATLDYFRRLRNGDTVRLEAVPLSGTRVEIYRFL